MDYDVLVLGGGIIGCGAVAVKTGSGSYRGSGVSRDEGLAGHEASVVCWRSAADCTKSIAACAAPTQAGRARAVPTGQLLLRGVRWPTD